MADNHVNVLFSDLDGTLVHYPKELAEYADIVSRDEKAETVTFKYKGTGEERECLTMTSMTGGKAYISIRTKALIKELRELGVVFVIITGARASTYIKRRPLLPEADFEFFENGGRKLERGVLDATWTDQFVDQVGQIADRFELLPDLPPPSERDGSLWSLHNVMVAELWKVDARDYTVNFRVDVAKSLGKTESDLRALADRECGVRSLATSFNLGKADFYPERSGKRNAAQHVLEKLGLSTENAVALFDDDNDLEMGELCGRSFLPSVTHPSVLEALKRNPQWTLVDQCGFLGTESALESIIELRKLAMTKQKKLSMTA